MNTVTASEPRDLDALVALLRGRRIALLTGAGVSTESGIPDYRGPKTRHKTRNPIQYRQFMRDPGARRRYWSRSFVGWPRMRAARPNAGHDALASLEAAGLVSGLITQNVDRLHHAAGSRGVVELHGALAEVRCVGCGAFEDRDAFQERLAAANPDWHARAREIAPDGDAELAGRDERDFVVPACAACADGIMKPHVVFFGENVPRDRVDAAWRIVEDADVLLVVGSSLTVFSGYRFVRGAAERGVDVAIVNLGPTRGDPHAAVRVDEPAGAALPELVRHLTQ